MFTTEQQKEIFQAIKANEEKTSGIIHVHIRKKCKQNVLKDAEKYFKKSKLNKSKYNNAVLIFIGETSRRFAILGDTAIHEHCQQEFWDKSRDILANYLKQGKYLEGIIATINEIGSRLEKHFPIHKDDSHIEDLKNAVSED